MRAYGTVLGCCALADLLLAASTFALVPRFAVQETLFLPSLEMIIFSVGFLGSVRNHARTVRPREIGKVPGRTPWACRRSSSPAARARCSAGERATPRSVSSRDTVSGVLSGSSPEVLVVALVQSVCLISLSFLHRFLAMSGQGPSRRLSAAACLVLLACPLALAVRSTSVFSLGDRIAPRSPGTSCSSAIQCSGSSCSTAQRWKWILSGSTSQVRWSFRFIFDSTHSLPSQFFCFFQLVSKTFTYLRRR